MAKRSSAKRAARQASNSEAKVKTLFRGGPDAQGGWDPMMAEGDGQRDKSYVRKVRPQSENQKVLLNAMDSHNLCLALGPAGTGKTYLAIAKAVEALEDGRVGRIILSRPAVEAGESLGFLPGDMEDKLAPYLRPLYDALNDRLGGKRLRALLGDGTIEIAPVGYMRGRTLNNSFIVIDEGRNQRGSPIGRRFRKKLDGYRFFRIIIKRKGAGISEQSKRKTISHVPK